MDINIVNNLIRFQTIVKYHHWATPSYDTHKITDNMFDFLTLVEKSEEIHCVESSFQCLVDSLNLNKKLYYHLHDVLASPNQRSSWIVV